MVLLFLPPGVHFRRRSTERTGAAAGAQSLYRLDIAQAGGTIDDCDPCPLVGGETEYVAAVAPTIEAIGALETATRVSIGISWRWLWKTADPSS